MLLRMRRTSLWYLHPDQRGRVWVWCRDGLVAVHRLAVLLGTLDDNEASHDGGERQDEGTGGKDSVAR